MNEFNVRVYGVLIHQGKLLVSDEYIKGAFYTKLPGGGLELGEGTKDCLEREFREETGLEVEVGQHLYTTDFYQMSAFNANQQIISIYYWVHCSDAALMSLKTHTTPFDFEGAEKKNPDQDIESFRWVAWDKVASEIMSLPIDQKVMELIVSRRPVTAQLLSSQPAAYFVQKSPFVVPTEDGKLIEEHFGIAATKGEGISVAHMVAPAGWAEPAQWPQFDEWTLISSGKKCVEINGDQVILEAGQSIWVSRGAKVRYSNPFDEPCDYWSVCLPAFSPNLVHREPA